MPLVRWSSLFGRLALVMAFLGTTAGLHANHGGPLRAEPWALVDTIELVDGSSDARHDRLLVTALTVLLGPFGAHRLYLGTDAKVVIAYGLTFGGFGVLALIDLGHLIFSKDLAPYRSNNRILMWSKPREEPTPP